MLGARLASSHRKVRLRDRTPAKTSGKGKDVKDPAKVVVAGAGIGGLTGAIALRRAGLEVAVAPGLGCRPHPGAPRNATRGVEGDGPPLPYTRCAAEEMPNPAATRPRGDADRGPPPRRRADVAGPGGVRGGQDAEGALARAARSGGPVGKRAVPRPESARPPPSVARKVSSPFLSFGTHPLRVILTVTGEGCRKRAAPAGPRGSRRARARPSPGRSRCSSRAFSNALTNSSRRKSPSGSKARTLAATVTVSEAEARLARLEPSPILQRPSDNAGRFAPNEAYLNASPRRN